MESAKKEMERIKGNPSLADTFGMKAEYDYKQAKADFEKAETSVWEEFAKEMKEIGGNLESTYRKSNQARPEDLDRDGLELLRSGIMTVDEIGSLLDRYEDNPTMRRLIVQHIEQLMSEEKDSQVRQKLIAVRQKAAARDPMEVWRGLEKAARICSGQAHGKGAPSYVLSISGRWEELTEKAVRDF